MGHSRHPAGIPRGAHRERRRADRAGVRAGALSVTQEIGDGWIDHARSAVLQVPSAVVRGATNYIVNPEHPDFGAIRTGPISRFRYYPRLAQ